MKIRNLFFSLFCAKAKLNPFYLFFMIKLKKKTKLYMKSQANIKNDQLHEKKPV